MDTDYIQESENIAEQEENRERKEEWEEGKHVALFS